MRLLLFSAIILTALLPCAGQSAAPDAPGLPKDPREIFAEAAPFYEFNTETLKPLHLKATYQLYDEIGKPTEQGTYEYWWVLPKIHRSSWTRPGMTHTDWYAADGKHSYLYAGGRLKFFERGLQEALFSPLPGKVALSPEKSSLDLEDKLSNGVKFPCISLKPLAGVRNLSLGFYSTYCFDPKLPALRASIASDNVMMQFNSIGKVQDRFLAREIVVLYGKRKLFSAKVDSISDLDSSDPALTPAQDAVEAKVKRVEGSGGVAMGYLIHRETPSYPADAKRLRVEGTVMISGTIGIDGKIHDMEVVVSPAESLSAAALDAVSHWEYKPYLLNGQPVEVDTTINVVFSIGH
jgi:TonB family protein